MYSQRHVNITLISLPHFVFVLHSSFCPSLCTMLHIRNADHYQLMEVVVGPRNHIIDGVTGYLCCCVWPPFISVFLLSISWWQGSILAPAGWFTYQKEPTNLHHNRPPFTLRKWLCKYMTSLVGFLCPISSRCYLIQEVLLRWKINDSRQTYSRGQIQSIQMVK